MFNFSLHFSRRFSASLSAIAAVGVLALAGCARPPEVQHKPPLAQGQIPKITVVAGATQYDWSAARAGAQQGAQKWNAKVSWQTLSAKQMDAQIRQQEKVVAAAVSADGLVVVPLDPTELVPSVNRVAKAGVPVVAVGEDVYTLQSKLCFIASDEGRAGELAALQAISLRGAKGKVGVLLTPNPSPLELSRVQSFGSMMKSQAPNIEVQASGRLEELNDIKVLFLPDAATAHRVLAAEPTNAKLIAYGTDKQVQQSWKEGKIAALVTPDWKQMVERAVQTLVEYHQGTTPPKKIEIPPLLLVKQKK